MGGWNSQGAGKILKNLIKGDLEYIGGWKVTKNVIEKAMVFYHNFVSK